MTECTALSLNGRMLIDKRTGRLGVALHADRVSGYAAVQLLRLERPMWIVTVAATNQPFVYLVMKGLCKGWLDIGVAAVTELRLRNLQQIVFALKRMDAMTTCAPHIRFPVGGTFKIRMRSCMADKAFFTHDLGSSLAELEDLRCIASGFHMLFTGPMAGFARDAFAFVHQRKFPMRIVGKLLRNFRMTGLTNLRTYMLFRFSRALLMPAGLLLTFPSGVHPHHSRRPGQQ